MTGFFWHSNRLFGLDTGQEFQRRCWRDQYFSYWIQIPQFLTCSHTPVCLQYSVAFTWTNVPWAGWWPKMYHTTQFTTCTAVWVSSLKCSSDQATSLSAQGASTVFHHLRNKFQPVTVKYPQVPLTFSMLPFLSWWSWALLKNLCPMWSKCVPPSFRDLVLGSDLQAFSLSIPSACEALLPYPSSHIHILVP